jgi:hypothetical protein
MHFTHSILNVWNEVKTFEYSRIHIVESKHGLSNEYQSNFTTTAKRKSKPLIRPNAMCFYDLSRCDEKIPPFSAIILQTKVIRTNDVKTALIRCISLIQYWTVWNEVKTFEYCQINIVESKNGLSNEYQSNFTTMSKRKSQPLIRPISMSY